MYLLQFFVLNISFSLFLFNNTFLFNLHSLRNINLPNGLNYIAIEIATYYKYQIQILNIISYLFVFLNKFLGNVIQIYCEG